MPRSPSKKSTFETVCDGTEFFNSAQAGRYLGAGSDQIRQAVLHGALCPGRLGKHSIFTRKDLDRYRRLQREHEIAKALVAGLHPLDIYLAQPGRYAMRHVTSTMLEWARLSGVWIVEGPRGSYARWLERMGLMRCTPRELRRIIEALLKDPELGARVRALFLDQRSSAALALKSASAAAAQPS